MAVVRILSVIDARLDLLKSNPPQLSITVTGATATPGWTGLELVPLEKKISADGILDLEAVGEPPKGIVQQVVTPVSIGHVVTTDVEKIVGVKIHARSNDLVRLLGPQPDVAAPATEFTTLALGEEGPQPTTLALGEEGPQPTTLALGEEGPPPTTLALGEEGPPPTTFALGEEGPQPTTFALGEEGPMPTTFAFGEEGPMPTTFALGEEGPMPTTLALGEEGPGPKPFFGETDPRVDDPKGPFGENTPFDFGFRNPFGRR